MEVAEVRGPTDDGEAQEARSPEAAPSRNGLMSVNMANSVSLSAGLGYAQTLIDSRGSRIRYARYRSG